VQKRAVEKSQQARANAADKAAKQKRLEVLDEQTGALDRESEALTATDEARRLAKEASSAKAARKGTA